MTYTLVIKEEAFPDALEAYLYYEDKQVGLGERFLIELNVRYQQIEKNPQHYGFISADVEKTLRSVRLKTFPYIVIYDFSDHTVIVYAVHNYHKNRID